MIFNRLKSSVNKLSYHLVFFNLLPASLKSFRLAKLYSTQGAFFLVSIPPMLKSSNGEKTNNLMLDLKKKAYYEKPSEIKRHKKNLAKLRTKYAIEKEKAKKNY